MGLEEHKARAPRVVACAVITISDTRTAATDTSGRAIVDLLEAAGHRVVARSIVPDDPPRIRAAVDACMADPAVSAIVTTGGTGVSPRDVTCETISALFDKHLDGFGELFRMLSFAEIGSAAMLSRAMAGTVSDKVLFVLPGSEPAVRLATSRLIARELGHLIEHLRR